MTGPKKDKTTGSFEDYLINELQDAEYASEYLNAAIEDGDMSIFLMALGDVVKARGMSKIAQTTGLNRENIYRIVSHRGNPQIKSITAILNALGMTLHVQPALDTRSAAVTQKPANVHSFEEYANLRKQPTRTRTKTTPTKRTKPA